MPPRPLGPSLGSHRCIYRGAFRADVSMSVHGTPVNNVLNPRARARPAILQPSRPAFLHTPRVQKRAPGRTGGGGRILAFGDGFSAVRDIYFTTILIASVGREDDCGGLDVPSGSTIYSTLTYERKREPFKTRWCIQGPDSGLSSFPVGRQAGVDCRICRTWNDARLRRRIE